MAYLKTKKMVEGVQGHNIYLHIFVRFILFNLICNMTIIFQFEFIT